MEEEKEAPCTVIFPPYGVVDLADKVRPVCDVERLQNVENFAFVRAEVDITGLKEKLKNLPSNAWEDTHQEGNVKLHRPAHDNWGIRKIVFTFCDDFLSRVFDLPWSQAEEWRIHLLPIYKAIGVDEKKVVRCLLASMPPGMTIPVHHDTGYWVKHTHRCHVPIESGPEVDFLVGPNIHQMKKVIFEEGKVIELNNRSKHSVDNKMKTRRIHLIFDYVEDHPVTRYMLKPGEVVNQTRRSIDLASEEGSRMSPSFIIIGAQKSGTTSIYEYLCQHPLVLKGKRRETHFFDWRWNASLTTTKEQQDYYMNYFDRDSLFKYPSLMTGESTPSYLLHSDIVIPRLKAICPWAKIIVVLRNPTDRAFSQYQMCVDKEGTPEQLQVRGMSAYVGRSFEEAVDEELAELQRLGIEADSTYEHFRSAFLSTRASLTHGGHSVVARGLYALQLEPWLAAFPPSEGNLMVTTLGELKGGSEKVQVTMDKVFTFVGLPQHDLEDPAAKNSRPYAPMSPETRKRLDEFYEPHNRRLQQLLGRCDLDW